MRVPAAVVALLAALQIPAACLHIMTGRGVAIDQMAYRGDIMPPETPAGYAFSIWSVIFALSIAYGIYDMRRGRDHQVCAALSLPLAVLFALSSVWMALAQFMGAGWHLVLVIVAMWVFSVKSLLIAQEAPLPGKAGLMLRALTGLYAGWLTAAMILNITSTVAITYGTFGLENDDYAMLTLIPAAVLGFGLMLRARGDSFAFAAIAWALIAIIVRNTVMAPNMLVTTCAVLCGFGVLGALIAAKRGKLT